MEHKAHDGRRVFKEFVSRGGMGRMDHPPLTTKTTRALARRACALRALGLLLYSRKGEDFLTGQLDFFTETAVTPERKVEKSFPRWEINRHGEG